MPSLNDISLRQLEYVVAVADLLRFRKAAEHCHVSQPALSAQIQQLEEVLGVKLFERDKRRVMLTAAGEELVARARRVLTETGDILSAASRLSDPFAGILQLGVIPTVAPYVLPEVVPAVMKKYPQLKLRLREEKTELLVRGLEEGGLGGWGGGWGRATGSWETWSKPSSRRIPSSSPRLLDTRW